MTSSHILPEVHTRKHFEFGKWLIYYLGIGVQFPQPLPPTQPTHMSNELYSDIMLV